MTKPDPFSVEVHFVPLPSDEADERKQRFRVLLLRGALRFLQQHTDGDKQAGKHGPKEAGRFDLVQK